MDTKHILLGIFVVLALVAALQSYQLSVLTARVSELSGKSISSPSLQSGYYQQPAQAAPTSLPTQVGGC